jgi:hypothetical protein
VPAFWPTGALPTGAMGSHIVAAIANDLVAGAPVLASPTLLQVNAITANALVSGAPVLASPALLQLHALQANGIATPAPILASPALAQVHNLVATALTAGAPVLASPSLSQLHALIANALTAGAPVLGTPVCVPVEVIVAANLTTPAPLLGSPALQQVHVLYAGELIVTLGFAPTGAIATGAQPPPGFVIHKPGLVMPAPMLASPPLHQVHNLIANGITTPAPILPGLVLISPSGLFVNYGGTWQAPVAYGKHGGVWKDVVRAYRRTATGWELIYERAQ